MQLDASRSRLARTVQNSTAVPADDLRLVVKFGSGFPSLTCTDIESEMHTARVDESWPASARAAVFTVTASDRCSVAKLSLQGVVATAPDGEAVDLGDVTITNQAWQWWPPFECHLE